MKTQNNQQVEMAEVIRLLHEIRDEIFQQRAVPDDWLDPEEACKILKVTRRTLSTYRLLEDLKFSKIRGKVFFRRGDILEFIKTHLAMKERNFIRHHRTNKREPRYKR